MRLPDMTIPHIPLPIEIAAHIHPSVVHFAIVIPVIILLLEVYNVAAKRPSISLFSFFLLLVLVFVLASSYLTGEVDGKNAIKFFSDDATRDLKEHTQIGIFLLYSSLVLLVFKIFFMSIRKTWGRILFILMLSVFVLGILYQAKQGGTLVYKYGANVETVRTLRNSSSEITADNKKMLEDLKVLQKENTQLKQKNQALSKSINGLATLKEEAKEAKSIAKKDANITVVNAQKEANKLLNESHIKAKTLLDNSKEEAAKISNESNAKAKTLLDNSKEEATKISNESNAKAKTLLDNSKEEAAKILNESNAKANALLDNSKKEAAKILANANNTAQIVMKNARESASALARAKKLIDSATTQIVSTDKNESNRSQ